MKSLIKITIILSLASVLFATQNEVSIIRNGGMTLTVKSSEIQCRNKLQTCNKKIEKMEKKINYLNQQVDYFKNEIKRLKKTKKRVSLLENRKKLIITFFRPNVFKIVRDAYLVDIANKKVEKWKKGRKFTSYLHDDKNRYKISGYFKNGKWVKEEKDLWIDKRYIIEARKKD
ncbi:hypothetical protein [Nitrosophilus alvini]|uniref:hypothetical protein n=1 Tax=Nitrosophilus alvini TaxID=2714855 RepID=UPI001909DDA0|nr:hypothetical protein [Nitrosophilus alvini]